MSAKVELAAALAKHLHAGQKYGKHDYFSHHLCGVVAYVKDNYSNAMPFALVDAICVGYLHDALEDTGCSYEVIDHLFGSQVVDAVYILTKAVSETRKQYLENFSTNPLATFVKICDAEFNRDQCLSDGDEKRAKYYQDAIDYLKGENNAA